jgi:hypothetical protein
MLLRGFVQPLARKLNVLPGRQRLGRLALDRGISRFLAVSGDLRDLDLDLRSGEPARIGPFCVPCRSLPAGSSRIDFLLTCGTIHPVLWRFCEFEKEKPTLCCSPLSAAFLLRRGEPDSNSHCRGR